MLAEYRTESAPIPSVLYAMKALISDTTESEYMNGCIGELVWFRSGTSWPVGIYSLLFVKREVEKKRTGGMHLR
jgi:hypothetical protein